MDNTGMLASRHRDNVVLVINPIRGSQNQEAYQEEYSPAIRSEGGYPHPKVTQMGTQVETQKSSGGSTTQFPQAQ
jgi:hypothetical protein